ncbi:MAG TPA: hypothetical protein VFW33_18200, partial [Gemmataceae bacterium]|nr:hypothetical protein [Gemmataceae bacterium]
KAANAVTSVTQSYTLTVDQPPVITSADSTTFLTTRSNTFTITTTGFPVATITFVGGTLPTGVTLVNKGNGTAILSGKPTAKGSFVFTIMAGNGVLPDAWETFDLTVN